MGIELLKRVASGELPQPPHSDICYIPDIVNRIAEELTVDTFIDVEPCICVYMRELSDTIILGNGYSLGDYVYDRELDKYVVEIEDDGGIDLYCGDIKMSNAKGCHGISDDIWYYHVGIMCRNYDGLLIVVRLIMEDLFHTISPESLRFIRKYRPLAIRNIIEEIQKSAVYIGFHDNTFHRYRTGSTQSDAVSSAVNEILEKFINTLGR